VALIPLKEFYHQTKSLSKIQLSFFHNRHSNPILPLPIKNL
jgi:hypothetical protein